MVLAAMEKLGNSEQGAASLTLTIDDERWIVGMTFIEELEWFCTIVGATRGKSFASNYESQFRCICIDFRHGNVGHLALIDLIIIRRIKRLSCLMPGQCTSVAT